MIVAAAALADSAVLTVRASSTPLWQYLASTLVALLAAGAGAVAIVNFVLKRRTNVAVRLGILPTPLYTLGEAGHDSFVVRPTENMRRLQSTTAAVGVVAPVVTLNISNRAESAVSVNHVVWSIAVAPSDQGRRAVTTVVAKFADAQDRAAVEAAYSLEPLMDQSGFVSYACQSDTADDLVAQLQADPKVAATFVDVEVAGHAEWTVQETVDILLDRSAELTSAVEKVVEPGSTLSLSYRVGSASDLRATVVLSLLLDSRKTLAVGSLDLALAVPAFVRLTPAEPQERT